MAPETDLKSPLESEAGLAHARFPRAHTRSINRATEPPELLAGRRVANKLAAHVRYFAEMRGGLSAASRFNSAPEVADRARDAISLLHELEMRYQAILDHLHARAP